MKAFLSHSSANKQLVVRIHEELTPDAAWLDRAEIEWGGLFLEKISAAIEEATDFVLFWSRDASQSNWVRLELNMAFIRLLRERAMRLRVVILDQTPLPLYLQPFHFLDASGATDPKALILKHLRTALQLPAEVQRHRFLNRHSELNRIEIAIDDLNTKIIVVTGVQGIGKRSLADEAFRRFFGSKDHIIIDVSAGTDLPELALKLNAHSRNRPLDIGLSREQLRVELSLSMEVIAKSGRLLLITNVQHWLDENSTPVTPLIDLIDVVQTIPGFRQKPIIATSTRRVIFDVSHANNITVIWIDGLPAEHMRTLLRIWYGVIQGTELSHDDAGRVASQLHGHPIAAKLAADLISQYGVNYLLAYPAPVIKLRRDLARHLVSGIPLSRSAEDLLGGLSMIGIPIPAPVICAGLGLTDEQFQQAIDQASRAGLITPGLAMDVHPLFRDFFWRQHWHREDYKPVASAVAIAIWEYAQHHPVGSIEFAELLPVAVRAFALAGDYNQARAIRSDMRGELLHAAIAHYNRRDYDLAEAYIDHVLDDDRTDWRARLYKSRILIRRQKWEDADILLDEMLEERPWDKGVRHAKGWRYLRARDFPRALDIFLDILSDSDHVRSLRDAAECLHQLGQSDEALRLLERAVTVESENPYVLDLQARIFEDRKQLSEAFEAASLAAVRDSANWAFHHRLGRILVKQRRPRDSLPHFNRAVELAPEQFTPASSLIAAMLDSGGDANKIYEKLAKLIQVCKTPRDNEIATNLRARLYKIDGKLDEAVKLLEGEIGRGRNLVPNYGVLGEVRLAQCDRDRENYPASANIYREQARTAIERGLEIEPQNEILLSLRERLAD